MIETLVFQCLTFGKPISEKFVPTGNYIVGEEKYFFFYPPMFSSEAFID